MDLNLIIFRYLNTYFEGQFVVLSTHQEITLTTSMDEATRIPFDQLRVTSSDLCLKLGKLDSLSNWEVGTVDCRDGSNDVISAGSLDFWRDMSDVTAEAIFEKLTGYALQPLEPDVALAWQPSKRTFWIYIEDKLFLQILGHSLTDAANRFMETLDRLNTPAYRFEICPSQDGTADRSRGLTYESGVVVNTSSSTEGEPI